MKILDRVISLNELSRIEDKTYFSDMNMVKAVVDIDRELLAVNAELHSDLEKLVTVQNPLKDSSNFCAKQRF